MIDDIIELSNQMGLRPMEVELIKEYYWIGYKVYGEIHEQPKGNDAAKVYIPERKELAYNMAKRKLFCIIDSWHRKI